MDGRRRMSWLLIAGLAALAAIVLALGYWAWRQQANSIRAEAERSLRAVGDLKADEIGVWLSDRNNDAESAANDPLLSDAVERILSRPQDPSLKGQVQVRLESIRRSNGFLRVDLVRRDGSIVAAALATLSSPLAPASQALAHKAIDEREGLSSDLYLSAAGQPRLAWAAPLTGRWRGRNHVAIVLVMDPSTFLYPFLQDWPLTTQSGETLLVKRVGDRALFLNELKYRPRTALRMTIPLTRDDVPAVQAVKGARGIVNGVDYRGVPVIADITKVPGTDWFVITKVDRSEVLDPIYRRAWIIAGFTVLILVLGGSALYLFWRNRERQVSAAMGASESRFRTLFENMTEGVALHEMVRDDDGAIVDYRIVGVNPAYQEQTGIATEDAVGRMSSEVYGTPGPPYLTEFAASALSGVPDHIQLCFEPLDKYFDVTIVPYGQDGFATVFQDVTGQVRRTEELRASERKFRETIELLDEGYYSAGIEGTLLDHNPAFSRLLGYPGDADLRGMGTAQFWVDTDLRERYLERIRKEDVVHDFLFRVNKADGDEGVVLMNAHTVKDDEGEIIRIDGTVTDYTARSRAEEEIARLNAELEWRVSERTAQLDAANKELEAFAYSVSHDLRAPLRHISGFSELLAKRTAGDLDEKSNHYVDVISTSVRHMGELIDDLLQFSRAGRVELTMEALDTTAVLAEALTELTSEIRRRDIIWTFGRLPEVIGDRSLIRQVWVNLIGNAVKYTRGRKPAQIDVGSSNGGDGDVVFFVRDNGVGFDMHYADKLFGVFQRLHSAEAFEGTGIGLANVRRIITRHGGRVWAESEPDQGASFYFTVPQRKERPS